jgi:hypothetical protein
MRTIAKVVCPTVALVLVVTFMIGVSPFNREPEATSAIGAILLAVLAAGTQLPLAVAPFVRPKRPFESVVLRLMMLPTTALLIMGAIDLLPRLFVGDELPTGTVAIEVLALVAYAIAYAVTLKPSPPSAPLERPDRQVREANA